MITLIYLYEIIENNWKYNGDKMILGRGSRGLNGLNGWVWRWDRIEQVFTSN
jgi:hypothetical protein